MDARKIKDVKNIPSISVISKKENEYVASCPELEIFCYGKDEQQARQRIKKVIRFYIETANELGYPIDESRFMKLL